MTMLFLPSGDCLAWMCYHFALVLRCTLLNDFDITKGEYVKLEMFHAGIHANVLEHSVVCGDFFSLFLLDVTLRCFA